LRTPILRIKLFFCIEIVKTGNFV